MIKIPDIASMINIVSLVNIVETINILHAVIVVNNKMTAVALAIMIY